MMLVLRKNLRYVAAILGLAAIGVLVSIYILREQGARFPIFSEQPVRMTAVLSNAQAVTPGQGQSVQIAGVKIGKIGEVELRGGRAEVTLEIEPKHVERGLIRSDARAMLRPRTALKDMYIQVLPGSMKAPAAREGFSIPVQNTTTDVDLDEILAELDQRTRDYLTLLLEGTGEGLRGRGADLAEVFRRFGPTIRDLERVNRAVAQERRALRRLVTSLARFNGELARKPRDLSRLVSASEATFQAFAAENGAGLRGTVQELPGTLRQATRTLNEIAPFARALGLATEGLTPTMRALTEANRDVAPFARRALAPVRDQIRPFVRESQGLLADLRPAATSLAGSLPELRRSATVLNRFFNMLAFNKEGREAPDKAGRDEGYLFWLAWVQHLGVNLINVDDANGPMRPIFLTGTCGTLATLVNDQPELEFAFGLSPILATLCGNPATRSTDVQRARKVGP